VHWPPLRISSELERVSFRRPTVWGVSAPEARRILRRLEFPFVPKHASWPSMANGRDRGWGAAPSVYGPAQWQARASGVRDLRLGASAQGRGGPCEMDVDHGASASPTPRNSRTPSSGPHHLADVRSRAAVASMVAWASLPHHRAGDAMRLGEAPDMRQVRCFEGRRWRLRGTLIFHAADAA
jgi:hypothetical protein